MDDQQFSNRVQQVLEAFHDERPDFDGLMDGMTLDCTDDQWQSLLHTLESERQKIKETAKQADERVAKLSVFRPGTEEFTVPGTVWLVTRVMYGVLEVVDVCATRMGAAEAAGSHAMMMRQMASRGARTVSWRGDWKRSEAGCPCPELSCQHEQWTRHTRGDGEYIIQTWSTADGKSRFTPGDTGPV